MTEAMKLKDTLWKKSYDKPRQPIKKQRHHFANKGPSSQSYSFSSRHVWMWKLDHKQGWVPKNWCFWVAVLEKTLESPLDCKEIKPINPQGNQLWMFIGRTEAEAEASADVQSRPWKRPWSWERLKTGGEGATEDEMVAWHHWLSGHKFEQTPGDSGRQRCLVCYSSGSHKELEMT